MIVYDFEVFSHNWMVHFIDLFKQERVTIIDNPDELRNYYDGNKDSIWVGFNNIHYDQYIFKGLLLGLNPKEINDFIINKKRSGWEFSNLFWKIQMFNYDTMTTFNGLKTLEAFMGHNIKETSVPFNIDRPLTPDELIEVEEYCRYDVEQTVEVFMRTQNEFNAKMDLIKEFNLPLSNISKSNAQLSAEVLDCNLQPRRDEFNLNFPEELRIVKYAEIKNWYGNPVNHDYKQKQEVIVAGIPHVFAWGGLHGARDNYIKKGKFVLVDVSSYYPSIMIEYDYMSRNIADPMRFVNMYSERFRLKALGDKKEQVFKLVLNTTYGCMGYKFNKLFDKRMQNNVCVTGQLFLLDLLESFEAIRGIEVVQSNTDGILLNYETDEQLQAIKEVSEEWSTRSRFNLGYDYFHTIIQKDVNNYMALGDKDVFVGAYVKDLSELDNDLPIINRCIREYFINGTPPEQTIAKENKLIEYQKIVKVSHLYEYAIHNGKRLAENTIRVFASSDPQDGQVLKYRNTETHRVQTAKFSNTSENCFIDNGHIKGKFIPRKLNKQWYVDLAYTRIKQFKGEIK